MAIYFRGQAMSAQYPAPPRENGQETPRSSEPWLSVERPKAKVKGRKVKPPTMTFLYQDVLEKAKRGNQKVAARAKRKA